MDVMDPDGRRRLALALLEAGVALTAAWLADPGRAPLRPWVWHHASRAARATAATFADIAWTAGRIAVHAEHRYWQSVQP